MLPDYLFDSFRRYKEDTSAFLSWLANTGLKIGYDLTISSSGVQYTSGQVSQAMTQQNLEALGSHQIIPLAELIASGPKKFSKIPAEIKGALRRAIKNRERCNAWYLEHPEEAVETGPKDDGHVYFIVILKEAQRALEKVALEKIARESNVSSPPEEPRLTTLFENLKMDDILDDEASELRSTTAAKHDESASGFKLNGKSPERKFTVKEVHDDPAMTIFCLLEDLARLRAFLEETWQSRKVGSISSISASIVTNTALDFAKALEKDSFDACSSIKGWEDAVRFLNKASSAKGKGLEDMPDELTLLELNTVLTKFRQLNHEEFKGYITRFIRQYTDSKHLKDPDKLEVLTMLPLFQHLFNDGKLPGRDHFTLGLRSILETKKIELCTVFGLQVFMDTLYIMRGDIGTGFHDLRKTAKRVQKSAGKYFSYNDRMLPPLEDGYTTGMKRLQDSSAFYAKEFDPKEDKALLMLSNHPLGHGLENGMMKLACYEAGKRISDYLNVVRGSLHLYNVLLQENKLEGPWPDMEETMEYFTPEKVFVGPRPKGKPDCLRRCELADGASLTNYAKNSRKLGFKRSSNPRRSMFETIPVLEMLCQRYLDFPDGPLPIPIDQKVIEDIVGNYPTGKNNKSHRSKLRKQWCASHKIGPAQLLTMLRDAIGDAEPRLNFDFFAAHRRAWRLLRTVYADWQGPLSRKFPNIDRIDGQNMDRVIHAVPLMMLSLCLTNHKETKERGESMMTRSAQVIEMYRAEEEREGLNANFTFGAGVYNGSKFVGIAQGGS